MPQQRCGTHHYTNVIRYCASTKFSNRVIVRIFGSRTTNRMVWSAFGYLGSMSRIIDTLFLKIVIWYGHGWAARTYEVSPTPWDEASAHLIKSCYSTSRQAQLPLPPSTMPPGKTSPHGQKLWSLRASAICVRKNRTLTMRRTQAWFHEFPALLCTKFPCSTYKVPCWRRA